MHNSDLIRRSYPCEVRAAENTERGRLITGRPIVYNTKTDLGLFDEIIVPGALDHTDLTDVRFLINHDLSKIPLARSRRNNGNSTMQLIVDSAGMGINTYLDTENNADARALYSAVERGDISGMSFMFGIKGERWEGLDTEHPTRFITDISVVIEVSAVTFPAYDSTEISARGREALESARAVLERARRSRAGAVETVPNDLELLKLKAQLSFMNGGI